MTIGFKRKGEERMNDNTRVFSYVNNKNITPPPLHFNLNQENVKF